MEMCEKLCSASGLIRTKGPTARGPHICTHSNNRQHFLKVRNNREQFPLTVTEDRTHAHVQRRDCVTSHSYGRTQDRSVI